MSDYSEDPCSLIQPSERQICKWLGTFDGELRFGCENDCSSWSNLQLVSLLQKSSVSVQGRFDLPNNRPSESRVSVMMSGPRSQFIHLGEHLHRIHVICPITADLLGGEPNFHEELASSRDSPVYSGPGLFQRQDSKPSPGSQLVGQSIVRIPARLWVRSWDGAYIGINQ